MAKFAKWIGMGLGWAFMGPIGGILGFFLGSMADQNSSQTRRVGGRRTTQGDFVLSMLVLVAAVMKSDGRVMKSELDYVKKYFVRVFGAESAKEATRMLRDLLKQDIPVTDVSRQIGKQLNYSSRLQLLQFLYGIAMADGVADASEMKLIHHISQQMGVSEADRQSIQSMYVIDTDSDYKILEIDKKASDDEVKKSYRRMAMKFHPDKVYNLGEEVRAEAEFKFKKVNEAYEKIKKERGMV